MRYSVCGRGLATAATINHVLAQLWNPSSTVPIFVTGVGLASTAATAGNYKLQRSSARGTVPTSTVTPTIVSDFERKIAPPSGAVLELATFTTQPTLDGVPNFQWPTPAAIGAGFMSPFETKDIPGIKILPGAGLCIANLTAAINPVSDITFFIME